MLDLDDLAVYRKLPWDSSGVHCNDIGDCFILDKSNIELVAQNTRQAQNKHSGIDQPAVVSVENAPDAATEPTGTDHHLNLKQNN
jgi:hypothetical protein